MDDFASLCACCEGTVGAPPRSEEQPRAPQDALVARKPRRGKLPPEAKERQQRAQFDARKEAIVRDLARGANDASCIGRVDERCLPVMDFLNSPSTPYVTTSSCSGRVSLFHTSGAAGEHDGATRERRGEEGKKRAGGRGWLLNSHELVTARDADAVAEAVGGFPAQAPGGSSSETVLLKFEPYLLHVECRDRVAARELLAAAVDAGFRNSGCTLGTRLIVAIRHTMGVALPVVLRGRRVADGEYVRTVLLEHCNALMLENWRRAELLLTTVKKKLSPP